MREISRRLGVSRTSVAKYARREDFPPAPPAHLARPGASELTRFEHIIGAWLGENQRRNLWPRPVAERIFDRLVDEHGFTGAYSPVQRHVKKWLAARRQPGEGITELVWPAGTVSSGFNRKAVENGTVAQDMPANHSPFFYPAIDPTLGAATPAQAVAALAYLGQE